MGPSGALARVLSEIPPCVPDRQRTFAKRKSAKLTCTEIITLNKRDSQPSAGGIQCDSSTRRTPSHDE